MASPPETPIDRRSSTDYFTGSPLTRAASSVHSRHSSQAYSPTHSRGGSLHASDNLAAELGRESLADELGGWGEEDEGEEDEYTEDEEDQNDVGHGERERDSGIDLTSSPATKQNGQFLDVSIRTGKGHRRKESDYDGSEYGSESDLEDTQLVSASLEARLAAVESLARRGTGDISGIENTIGRATQQLQDLGGQSAIETGSTRLTTANNAISTHLAHQTRIFQQLTATLLSPLSYPLSSDAIDDIIPQIDMTLSILALLTPNPAASASLRSLADSTTDLVDALSSLSDSVHMMRQSSNTASRRLRSVRDTLREWRRENTSREDGVRFIEQGCWNQRLQDRECASVCHDILSGFEQVCDSWRSRLFATQQAGSVAA